VHPPYELHVVILIKLLYSNAGLWTGWSFLSLKNDNSVVM
jgi:hypothetical protein